MTKYLVLLALVVPLLATQTPRIVIIGRVFYCALFCQEQTTTVIAKNLTTKSSTIFKMPFMEASWGRNYANFDLFC